MIFSGLTPGIPKGWNCGVTANLAWILPAGKIPPGLAHCKPSAVIHGIPVYRLASAKGTTGYLVPELGVRVGAPARLEPAARRPVGDLRNRPVDERAAAGRRDQAADVPAV